MRTASTPLDSDYSEAELETVMAYLNRHLPDPTWTDIIYWPNKHEIASIRSIESPTPEQVVEIALRYRPFAL